MRFYFSGVTKGEIPLLKAAKARYVLSDQFDLEATIDGYSRKWGILVDSGAYKAYRGSGGPERVAPRYYVDKLQKIVQQWVSQGYKIQGVMSPDTFQDSADSYRKWLNTHKRWAIEVPLIPVWVLGESKARLNEYLQHSQVVAVGGIVPHLRVESDVSGAEKKAQEAHRNQTLKQLVSLCTSHPQRLHLLGLHWVNAIDALWHIAYSADSSRWIRSAARYHRAIFTNTRTGYLSDTPAKIVGLQLSREELAIYNARNIEAFSPVSWACEKCGKQYPHHIMRVLPASRRRCHCKGKVVPTILAK